MKAILLSVLTLMCLSCFGQQKQLRAFMQASPLPVNEIPYGANPKAGRYAASGDARIYYEVYGKGQPLLILHGGIFGSAYEMHQFIDSLSKTYRVITISTRGHGKSELGKVPVTYGQKAADVLAVLQSVTKDSAIVLGFSDGAYAGYSLASRYPERVKKLICIGATELHPGLRDFTFSVRQAVALDSAYWKQQFSLMPEPARLQEMFTSLGSMYNKLTLDSAFFQTIMCPTMVMAGDKDAGNPPARVVHTAQMIRNSQMAIIPNASHGVFLENFNAVWACIVPFLKN